MKRVVRDNSLGGAQKPEETTTTGEQASDVALGYSFGT